MAGGWVGAWTAVIVVRAEIYGIEPQFTVHTSSRSCKHGYKLLCLPFFPPFFLKMLVHCYIALCVAC